MKAKWVTGLLLRDFLKGLKVLVTGLELGDELLGDAPQTRWTLKRATVVVLSYLPVTR